MTTKSIFKSNSTNIRALVMVFALLAICIFFHIATDGIFLSAANITNLVRQSSIVGILAIGMLLVIVSGNIDLSVGSMVGFFGGIASIFFMKQEISLPLVILLTLSIGFIIGCMQGALTAYLRIPAFIVTLGGLLIFRGSIMAIMKGETISVSNEFQIFGSGFLSRQVSIWIFVAFILFFAITELRKRKTQKEFGIKVSTVTVFTARIISLAALLIFFLWVFVNPQSEIERVPISSPIHVPDNSPLANKPEYFSVNHPTSELVNQFAQVDDKAIPVPVILMVLLALLVHFISTRTVFGRRIFAIGGNAEAAWLSGINIKLNTMLVFGLCGLLSAVAGIVYTARLGSAAPDAAAGYELYAIAACVIGGTSLMGGRGTIFGAIIGALIMASLDSGMSILNIEPFYQNIIKGTVLILAVYIDVASKKKI
ncbi:sugar ABC transporter permease [Bacteroidota bacterium]|nr:sugar ABC transporter permease [Bacteroidota bacterium]